MCVTSKNRSIMARMKKTRARPKRLPEVDCKKAMVIISIIACKIILISDNIA